MKLTIQAGVFLAWFWAAAPAAAAPVPYSPDPDTIGLYHVDAAGVWMDATTNNRHLAASPGAVLVDTTDLAPAFANGYRGGTGDVGAVQYTNKNWIMGNTLTVEAWLKAGVSSNASPRLFTLYDKIYGPTLEFVLRDMNVPSGGNVLMVPTVGYSDTNGVWVQDSAPYACALSTGRWYHVAYVLDLAKGPHGQVAVYVTPKGAAAPVLFDTVALGTNLDKGPSTKSWTLDHSAGGAFVLDEFRISAKARAPLEFGTLDIRATWLSWGGGGSSLLGVATNVVPGSKVYRTGSLTSPSWTEATDGVFAGPSNGLYQFQCPLTNSPGFFTIGH